MKRRTYKAKRKSYQYRHPAARAQRLAKGGRRVRRVRKRRLVLKSRLFWGFLLGLVVICSIVYLLFFSPVFKLKEIKFISPREISIKPLQSIINQELKKKWLYFVDRDSFFLLRSQEIENSILTQFPEIKTADLIKKFPQGLLLEVKKREAAAVWCYLQPEQCVLIGRDRIIFAQANLEAAENLFLIFSQEKPKSILEEACSEKEMAQILRIKNTLQEKLNIALESFTKEDRKLLKVKAVEGWEIYFDLETDIELTLTKLELLLSQEIPEEERKNLQYIDLRFSKVYYK